MSRHRNGSALHAHGQPGSVYSVMQTSATSGMYPTRRTRYRLKSGLGADGDRGAAGVAPRIGDHDLRVAAGGNRADRAERTVLRLQRLTGPGAVGGDEDDLRCQRARGVQPVTEPAIQAVVLG